MVGLLGSQAHGNRIRPQGPTEISLGGMSKPKITVTIGKHHAGVLMCIEYDGRFMLLTRDEVFELIAQIQAKIGEMPVKL